MNARKKIMVTSAVAVRRECTLYALLCAAIIILLLGVIIFYLAALLSLQRHFYTPRRPSATVYPLVPAGGAVVETVNYHGLRPPPDFPKELIVGHPRTLLSSQELRYPGVGRLFFVSFTIPQTPDQVRRSYEEQLQDPALLSRPSAGVASALTLSSRQNGVSYDIAIQPYQQGSTVAIYYRIKS